MTSETIFLIVGMALVVIGVLGGGLEVRELKIPMVKAPTRIIAVIAGFLFVGMGVNAQHEAKGVSDSKGVVSESRSSPAESRGDGWLQSQVKNAVLKASSVEVDARVQNNPSLLREVYAGEALRNRSESIEKDARAGWYQDSELHGQEFSEISVSPDRQRAEVRLTEVYSARVRSLKNGQCLTQFAEFPVPQALSLRLIGEKWLVVDIATMGSAGAPQRCTVP